MEFILFFLVLPFFNSKPYIFATLHDFCCWKLLYLVERDLLQENKIHKMKRDKSYTKPLNERSSFE